MRILTADDIRAALTMREAIDAVREGFIALSTGKATVPLRGVLEAPAGITLTMPANMGAITTVKTVSVYPDNPSRGLPTVLAAVLALNGATGEPLALMEGRVLTAMRTGAASGLATELLAREDASVLAVIGAGAQARTQVEAVCAVRDIRKILIYSLNGAGPFAAELREKSPAQVRAVASVETALAGADIVIAATNSKTPVVYAAHVAPGAHVNGIGSFTPQMQEIADDLVMKAKVVVDHRASVWAEAGDLIIPRDAGLIDESIVYAEIGEIAAGTRPGRESDSEITVFKSVGNAVQDAAVAGRIIAAAEARDLGVEIALG